MGWEGPRPESHRVEVRVPGQATPDELEPQAFRDEIVGVEVDPFEHEVVAYEPGEKRDVEDDPRRGVAGVGEEVMRREREQVEFETNGADQVEEHLGVGPAAEHLRIDATPEIEIRQQVMPLVR